MSIFDRLFGTADAKPEGLATISEAAAALERLRVARAANVQRESEVIAERRAALGSDAADAVIAKHDRELEKICLDDERLDVLEPRIIARLSALQSSERAALLAQLRDIYNARAAALDAAMAAVLDPLADLQEAIRQLDAAGFSGEARAFVVAPPNVGNAIVISGETLENWRQQRERVADMHAAAAAPRPASAKPVAMGKAAEPEPVRESIKRAPSRAPLRHDGPVAYGFAKIAFLRAGVDLGDGMASVPGDEAVRPLEVANQIARSGAADIIEIGAAGADAAE
ncbi:hypothetical protein [Methylocystis sp. SB2]|uniref:hypothetical protein n=1 Tax=Methylocystis sp. (strain SB2) TaxID=743836 RepID=UPI0003FD13D1|nr:hypothetical protein [Methylocystis sp. SB2]ULO22977.1 hypothetical protein LNB28_12500 [Methylocystis sp. SB2]